MLAKCSNGIGIALNINIAEKTTAVTETGENPFAMQISISFATQTLINAHDSAAFLIASHGSSIATNTKHALLSEEEMCNTGIVSPLLYMFIITHISSIVYCLEYFL